MTPRNPAAYLGEMCPFNLACNDVARRSVGPPNVDKAGRAAYCLDVTDLKAAYLTAHLEPDISLFLEPPPGVDVDGLRTKVDKGTLWQHARSARGGSSFIQSRWTRPYFTQH